ncbi:MAG TPA: phosphomannomutase/phosphoglucomutase [Kiritimatiellia bacterium]|nr:phosphomannomutase/phosphoglucomutase [Kiritimatiellia bacterium]HRU69914.1 phosphomannomutase/phosphoglucomutase [Kiritimatiellia bacterium]
MSSIFKAYDIRGIYGQDLTDDMAYAIGRAFVTFTACRKVVVARDIRPHSEPLFAALAKGLTEQGTDVIDIGHGSTPMSYFANGTLGADASIMITASHNPAEWNGFKLCRAQAMPISGATGIKEIERIVAEGSFAPKNVPGTISQTDVQEAYSRHVAQFAHLQKPVHVAIDFANGMGIWEVKALKGLITWDGLYEDPDGRFPNHEANPLHHATLADLQAKVRAGGYAFGVAYDGDADRAGFVDERGEIIPMDLITALIAQDVLAARKGVIFYDLRSSWAVKEAIEAAGGTPMMSRVGHAFIKQQMREHDALFAGELSGHYYFKDNFTAESSALAILSLANIVSKSDRPLSELIAPLRKYFASGEINTHVTRDPKAILDELRTAYADGRVFELDGVSVEYADWWFNVRCSNTEPLVRLNLEARSEALMTAKRDEILAIIRK